MFRTPATGANGAGCTWPFTAAGSPPSRSGTAFYEHAGYNPWADENRLIVLYPQTRPTQPTPLAPLLPLNPHACWDWWGYNDGLNQRGRFATRDGLQIAAVRRMLDRLAGGRTAAASAPAVLGEFGELAGLTVGDFTHRQVALRWGAVAGAIGYNVYRSTSAGGPYGRSQRLNTRPVDSPLYVDTGLTQRSRYFYVVRAVNRSIRESEHTSEVGVLTAADAAALRPVLLLPPGHAGHAKQQADRGGVPLSLRAVPATLGQACERCPGGVCSFAAVMYRHP